MDTFGRGEELARIAAMLEDPSGDARALLLDGPAGIGKSTVWHDAVRRARGRGVAVLDCEAGALPADAALLGLSDLLAAVPTAALAALVAPQRRAVETLLMRTPAPDGGVDPRVLLLAVRSLLETLARDGPVLVAVDDVDRVDTATAQVLRYALRRARDVPVVTLVSVRGSASAAGPALESVGLAVDLPVLTIGPLDRQALHGLLVAHLGRPLPSPVLARIHRDSGGNPLHAIELARLRADGGEDAGTLAVPEDVRALIRRRVAHLPRATREALLAAAAMTRPHVRHLNDTALDPAEAQGIVRIDDDGSVTFAHPLHVAALYEIAGRAERRRVHAHLADSVADPEERARHLALSTVRPSRRVAAELDAAAVRARSRGSWDGAAQLWEHAARLTPGEDVHRRRERLLAAAEHHVHAGDRARGRRLLERLVAAECSDSLRCRAHLLLGEVADNDEHFMVARAHFRDALGCATTPVLAASSLLGLSFVEASLGDFRRGSACADEALEQAALAGDDEVLAQARALVVMMDLLCGHGVDGDALRAAVASEDPDAVVAGPRSPRLVAALVDLYVGRHEVARRGLEAVCANARARGDESDLAFTLVWLSWLETRTGRLDEADRLAREGRYVADVTGSRSYRAWLLGQQAYLDAHRGDRDKTLDGARRAAAEAADVGFQLPQLWVAAAIALVEVSHGHHEAAWQACRPLVEVLEADGLGEPVPLFFLPDALTSLVVLGRADRVEALARDLVATGDRLGRAWASAVGRRALGEAAASRGDLDAAESLLTDALSRLEGAGMPFELARTHLVLGRVRRRARQRSGARDSLTAALLLFEDIGAHRLVETCRCELQRTGIRRASSELTVTERRVAELAARGRTNREVAGELFLSTKTVEANLARVYRKLGIHSRAELGALLGAGTLQT